jgi:hypothetical protein
VLGELVLVDLQSADGNLSACVRLQQLFPCLPDQSGNVAELLLVPDDGASAQSCWLSVLSARSRSPGKGLHQGPYLVKERVGGDRWRGEAISFTTGDDEPCSMMLGLSGPQAVPVAPQ